MGSAADGASGAAAERAARRRLEDLLRAFDRLTPDELARIGYPRPPDEVREPLLDAVDEAAIRTGRVALMDEVRDSVVEAVLVRYSAEGLPPDVRGVELGAFARDRQGPGGDRRGTRRRRIGRRRGGRPGPGDRRCPHAGRGGDHEFLAAGEASEGSLAQAIRVPDGPDLRPGLGARYRRLIVAVVIVSVAIAILSGVGQLG